MSNSLLTLPLAGSITPLWIAAHHLRASTVTVLADLGADVNASYLGCTPLVATFKGPAYLERQTMSAAPTVYALLAANIFLLSLLKC